MCQYILKHQNPTTIDMIKYCSFLCGMATVIVCWMVNSLWLSYTKCLHIFAITLAQLMVCFLTVPSQKLKRCWFNISRVIGYSYQSDFVGIDRYAKMMKLVWTLYFWKYFHVHQGTIGLKSVPGGWFRFSLSWRWSPVGILLVSCLHSQLGYYAGVSQTLWMVVLAVFGVVD